MKAEGLKIRAKEFLLNRVVANVSLLFHWTSSKPLQISHIYSVVIYEHVSVI